VTVADRPSAAGELGSVSLAQDALDALPIALAVVDAEGVIVGVNAEWRRFGLANGGEPSAGIGANYLAVCARAYERSGEESAAAAAQGIRDLLAGRAESFSLEYPCHSPSEQRWFVARGSAFTSGGARLALVTHENVTARKLGDDALREREEKWRTLFELLPLGVTVLDERHMVVESNPALHRILRLTREQVAAGHHRRRRYLHTDGTPFAPDEQPSAQAVREQRAVHDVEMVVVPEHGEPMIVAVDAAPLRSPRNGAVIVVSDISARVRARQELVQARNALAAANFELEHALASQASLARSDFLTGINNRRHFYEATTHELARVERYRYPLSVILFDIDHFKEVNDRLGHQAGDRVLQRVAEVARASLRETDTLARHGGEEFAVLLPHVGFREAGIVAEHLRAAIAAARVDSELGPVGVTVSAGVAEALPAGDSVDRLLLRADQALYAAKAAGRNAVACAPPGGEGG
jgi:diguanylate cyclase (GGDEF)-like protein/PAS domain S-box-containing protein